MAKKPTSSNSDRADPKKNKSLAIRNVLKKMPAAKAAVPFHFWRRAKKRAVFWKPIMRVRPIRNRIWRLG